MTWVLTSKRIAREEQQPGPASGSGSGSYQRVSAQGGFSSLPPWGARIRELLERLVRTATGQQDAVGRAERGAARHGQGATTRRWGWRWATTAATPAQAQVEGACARFTRSGELGPVLGARRVDRLGRRASG